MSLSEVKSFKTSSPYQASDVTFFTVPKPFVEGHVDIIQRNAIQSWVELGSEVILCGDEPEIEEITSEFGIKHIQDIDRNEYGTPLLDSVFKKVEETSNTKLLCYVNTDIIFLSDIIKALKCINLKNFLMTGLRLNIELNRPINFKSPDWEQELKEFAIAKGRFYEFRGFDYFLFTRDHKLLNLPPFVVGRPPWDNWFIYNARLHNTPIIDCTEFVMAIHQIHDYYHVPKREKDTGWEGPEASYNRKLCKDGFLFILEDASHLLSKAGKLEKIKDRTKQSSSFRKLGQSFRKRNKSKALAFYLKSLCYKYDPVTIKAIIKLFIPGYYKRRDW